MAIKGGIKSLVAVGIAALALLLAFFIFVPENELQHIDNSGNHANSGDGKDSDLPIEQDNQKNSGLPIEPGNQSGKNADDGFSEIQNSESLDFIDVNVFKLVSDELQLHKLKTPKLLVKMRFNGTLPFQEIVKLYDESSLPQFYEILKDENRPGRELEMAVIYIGFIGKRGNKEAVKELLDYYKRSIKWDKWRYSERETDHHVFAKFDALSWMGFIGGNDVETVLKQAMAVEGAKELAKEWLEDCPPLTFSALDNLRGCAALGLAFSGKKEVHKLIKDEYEKERQACIDAGVKSGAYFNLLCTAMTRIDIVKKIGYEGHRKLHEERVRIPIYTGCISASTYYLKQLSL